MRQDPPPAYRDVTGLKEEITDLVGGVDAIDKQFLQTRRALSETILDPNDQFKKFRESYIQLVWKSRETAAKASAVTKGDRSLLRISKPLTDGGQISAAICCPIYWMWTSPPTRRSKNSRL